MTRALALDARARCPSEQLARLLAAPVVTLTPGSRPTWRDAVPPFLRWLVLTDGRATLTALAYGRALRGLAGWSEAHGLDYPDQLTCRELETYLASVTARGCRASTGQQTLYAARALWRWLLRGDHVSSDPSRLVRAPKVVRREPVYAVPGAQDAALAQLAADASPGGRRDHALIAVGFLAGLRLAELVTLTVDRVDLADADRTGEAARLHVIGKGRRERIVPVVPRLRAILGAYLRDTRPFLEAWGGPSPYVFLRVPRRGRWGGTIPPAGHRRRLAGVPLTTRTAWRIVVDRLRPILGPSFHPHALRHSFGARIRWNHGDVQLLQQLLGHQDLATTERYSHLPTRGRAAELARLLAPEPAAAAPGDPPMPRGPARARRADVALGPHADLGARLTAARLRLGLTQAVLARRAGIGRVTLVELERGAYRPRPATLQAIAAALHTSADWILTGRDGSGP